MARDQVIQGLRNYFAERPRGVVAAWLFGSVARGDDRPDSDIDIGVLLDVHGNLDLADLDRCAAIQGDLVDLMHRPVDLVPLDGASPDLQFRVLRDGVLVFEADAAARIEFEIHVRNEYFDLLPYLLRYRDTVLRRA